MSHTPAYTVIQTPEADKLADIRDVSVNKDLPREERIAEFIRQIPGPVSFQMRQICCPGKFFPGRCHPGGMSARNPSLKFADFFHFGG